MSAHRSATRLLPTVAALVAVLLAAACSSGGQEPPAARPTTVSSTASPAGGASSAPSSAPSSAAPSGGASGTPSAVDRRPPDISVPSGGNRRGPMPLLLLLHGYTSNSAEVDLYFGLRERAAAAGFLYVRPNGTVDGRGGQFWDATDACCDLFDTGVDDSGYLLGLIDTLAREYPVDPRRVYVMGHSNGGFMAYRMACDHADRVAAVVSVAGAMHADRADCTPAAPVSVLQVHGTDDELVPYEGGQIQGDDVPPAARTVDDWATLDACDPAPSRGSDVDVVDRADLRGTTRLAGAETGVQVYRGCARGTSVQLWTIRDGRHVPTFLPAFGEDVMDFLLAHPKPGA
ncbi:MAG: prolyl oligopeptidase family serine peptidase [Actinobacteria bacterium]|nr:prolyl oligopeptidase family serine peptidase [Actinomycetota bacterium]